ncbi:hypothetical protein [Cystobacter fuscus]|uniref:hypothetical protein n=1 Tax=Cystobacter fuscus TaxID=43 RepID=UPI002B289176|nr:hypothetical protein F0U63_17055 [Cystobacter fuscus]
MSADEIIRAGTSIASSLSAVAGASVAVYGAIRLIPRELAKWKEQKKAEQRATTAAKALNSALRFIDALLFIGNPLFRSPAEAKKRGENQEDEDVEEVSREAEFYARFSERLELAKADMEAFSDARDLATVFLDEEEERLLTELWVQWEKMRTSGELYAHYLSYGSIGAQIPESKKAYAGLFAQQERLEELRKSVIGLLRPIARMDEGPKQKALPERSTSSEALPERSTSSEALQGSRKPVR